PRQPAARLALARLDRRVAQRRQGLRPHGQGDARRRRAGARGPGDAAGDGLPGTQLQAAQPREVDAGCRRSHGPGVPRPDARLAMTRAAMTLFGLQGLKVLPALASVRKGQDAWQLADLDARIALSRHAVLMAQLAAEKQEDIDPKAEACQKAAIAATQAQRALAVLEAKRAVLVAEQALRFVKPKGRPKAEKQLAA